MPMTSADALLAVYARRAADAGSGPVTSDSDWRRDHLGASIAGHKCDRYLWLAFRWALDPKHPGQRLRLFARGEREEAWFIDDLRAAGFQVWSRDPDTGEQFRVQWGHVGGSLDGKILGLLEAPKTVHVLECKTHNAKSFARLKEKGVKTAKREHYVQMQLYMLGSHGSEKLTARDGGSEKLDRAYYLAVCKDTDELYAERVKFDREFAEEALARAQQIVAMEGPPERMDQNFPPCVYVSADGTRWPCQFFDLCHGSVMPAKSCRTCIESRPLPDGTWKCEHLQIALDGEAQRVACPSHVTIPPVVNMEVVHADEATRRVVFQAMDGKQYEGGAAC